MLESDLLDTLVHVPVPEQLFLILDSGTYSYDTWTP